MRGVCRSQSPGRCDESRMATRGIGNVPNAEEDIRTGGDVLAGWKAACRSIESGLSEGHFSSPTWTI
jgi:hypothetical protein